MNLDHTLPFLDMLAGRDAVYDWRCLHDVHRGTEGVSLRGTIAQIAATLDAYQAQGYGVFIVVNETDGAGRSIENMRAMRANFIDYDVPDGSWSQYHRVAGWQVQPTFFVTGAVAGKFHAYWALDAFHADAVRWSDTQRRLAAMWNSDGAVIDTPRVMRVPGSMHLKNGASAAALVQFIPGSGRRVSSGVLEWALAGVVPAGGGASREELGDPDLSAPSFDWAVYALQRVDPNSLGREDWIKLSAAFKQAAWLHADAATIERVWSEWCARYLANDPAENAKNWRSFRQTKTGWQFLARFSGAEAEYKFGGQRVEPPAQAGAGAAAVKPPEGMQQPAVQGAGEFITATLRTGNQFYTPQEQLDYFAGCVFIERLGEIMTPNLRFMGPGDFNATYGGGQFVLTSDGKTTDEPWKAATRGQVFQVPKVDDIRFLPSRASGEIITDELGRRAVNIYRPAIVRTVDGDVTPFTAFLRALMPTEHDYQILVNYFAHVAQRPGVKAFWCPVIQSAEGAGKGLIGEALEYTVGRIYTHQPNTRVLADSGSKFNKWMRAKLLIIANEIRTDDRRDMLEALKPMITEARLEVEGKGADQEMEDNVSNWLMFTNHKDAIPIKSDSRRYAIFYATIQSVGDLAARGMNGDYFPRMYAWMRGEGRSIVAHWLRSMPIDPALDPAGAAHRAPVTSSHAEALAQSLGPIEQRIQEAIDGNEPGFRGGWLSSAAVGKLMRDAGLKPAPATLKQAYRTLGFYDMGRAGRAYFEEDQKQPHLWSKDQTANIANYGIAQGYI